MDTVAVVNQKGGVGKSSTVLGLAGAVADSGKKILVIDMDPQSNASQTLLPDFDERVASGEMFSTHDLLEAGVDPDDAPEAIVATTWPNVDLIPSVEALATREVEGSTGIETRLRRVLRGVPHGYDHILIDCPPSLGRLTVNALLAAGKVLLIAEPDMYSQQALTRTLTTLEQVRDSYDHSVEVLGVVINKVEIGTNEGQIRVAQIREQFADKVLAVLPKRTIVRVAAGRNQSVFHLNRPDAAQVAEGYRSLQTAIGW